MSRFLSLLLLLHSTVVFSQDSLWPPVVTEAKPGAYWWWMGSAVDADGLRWNIEQAAENEMGTLHIVPIYGVKGNDANELPFMSPKWVAMMETAVDEGKKHGVNIDMTLGTGWCFGGPGVADNNSSTLASFKQEEGGGISVALRRKAIMVKRPAPGGEGPMLDPFSLRGMENYLAWFDKHWAGYAGSMPRAVYHDSYEYRADWSDELDEAFEKLNGYRLRDHLDVFLFKGDENAVDADRVRRIKADYRRCLSEMHLAFTKRWTDWAKQRHLLTRNEAHGSPTNWLDVYAAADIPETEFFRNDKSPLVAKFASSAAHVAGRNYTSSESGTWADEHFHEKLGTLKVLFDGFFLSGINHLFYHGTIYSPETANWPGWSFYATTQMNPRNTIWRDAKYLNEYITRVQSVLQSGKPDNDILLLWTPEETWHRTLGTVIHFSVHNAKDWFTGSAAGILAQKLWNAGLTFDYVSPDQLKTLDVKDGRILTRGGEYRILLVPKIPYIDTDALARLVELSERGANVCFDAQYPKDVPGFYRLDERRKELDALKSKAPKPIPVPLFDHIRAKLNTPVSKGAPYLGATELKTISRRLDDGRYYFVANVAPQFDDVPEKRPPGIDTSFRLANSCKEIVLLDPMTGKTGRAQWRTDRESGLPEVRLQLRPNQSIILRTFDAKPELETADWQYFDKNERKRIELTGPWNVEFLSGGPAIPQPLEMATLKSWTENGSSYENFSGTAKYTLTFNADVDENSKRSTRRLNLGKVCESARLKLNGVELGCVFCEPMVLDFSSSLLKATGNVLEIDVTNLAANRIRFMDKEGIPWKIFKDTNIVNIDYKPLDASAWPVQASGLIGPVTLE